MPRYSVGRGADALELAARERRLEQVRCIQRTAGSRTRADQRVDLVDEQHGIGLFLERLQNGLETLFEIAAVLGAGQQRTHVERVDLSLFEDLGHLALRDAPGQALGDRRLAHTGLAHQQRVVLAAAAQDLDHALDLVLTADQRIDLAFLGLRIEVDRELLERRSLLALVGGARFLAGLGSRAFGRLGAVRRVALANAVRDEVHHVQACHALLVQVIDRMRILFAEDRNQHIGTGHFLLAIARGLHVHDGALDHALKTQRGLRVDFIGPRHGGRVVLDEVDQRCTQVVDVGRAGTQNLRRTRVVQQGQQ